MSRQKPLSRNQLAQFLPNAEAIKAFEKVMSAAYEILPNDILTLTARIDEVGIDTSNASATANQAIAVLEAIADAIEYLSIAPSSNQVITRLEEIANDIEYVSLNPASKLVRISEITDVKESLPAAGNVFIYNATLGQYENALLTQGAGMLITNADGSITIASTITAYTDEMAQDAVGGILTDTATIDLTYNDAGNLITADVKAASIVVSYMGASAADVLFGRSSAGAGAGQEIACTSSGRALIGLIGAANKLPYFNGVGTAGLADFTPAGFSLTLSANATIGGTHSGTSSGINTGDVANTALTTSTLAQFAATTSAQLAGVISDETGSGSLVFATSPTLTTPALGVAAATSVAAASTVLGAISTGRTLSTSYAYAMGGTVTDFAGAFGCTYSGITHTITANSTAQFLGYRSNNSLDQNTFNATSTAGAITGFYSDPKVIGASGTVTLLDGYIANPQNTGAGTVTTAVGFDAIGVTNSGGGSIGTAVGLRVKASTVGTVSYAAQLSLAAATDRWNLFADGTALNYALGNLQLGSTTATAGAEKLQVTGTASISSTLLVVGIQTISNATASTTTTTGALVVTGGVGVGGAMYIGGNIAVATAGKGLQVKEGSNACMGTATLVLGTATISTTAVLTASRIFLTVQSLGTVAVATPVAVTARTNATSFVITSSSATDTSVVAWMIVNPA